MPQKRRFYDLFKQQGKLVSDSLTELSKSLLEGRSRHPRLRELEHACDEVTSQIYELVNRTFVAPIEREDILLLASHLDDVVDLAEEVTDKLELYRIKQVTAPARAVGECLAAAGQQIERALEHLEGFQGLRERRGQINRLGEEGGRLTRDALGQAFADGRHAPSEAIQSEE